MNEFWFDANILKKRRAFLDAVDEGLGGHASHFDERLADGGERRDAEGCEGDVVETNHGNVLGNPQSCFLKRPNTTNRRNIVVSEQSCEGNIFGEQGLAGGVAEFGCGVETFQLQDQFGTNLDAKLRCDFLDGFPAGGGVGTVGLATEESDAFVAEFLQVGKSKLSGAMVIDNNICDILDGLVSSNSHHGKFRLGVDGSVDGNQAFDASGHEHA